MFSAWYLKDGKWICADVGEYYPFTYGEMIAMWRWIGPNAMRYWQATSPAA